ncbi:bifunctional YncE family protein/alkaline phosphatase family protein [Luteitalea sp.]
MRRLPMPPVIREGAVLGALLTCAATTTLLAQTVQQPLRGVTDPGVITTRQGITPAGIQSVFDGRVFGVAFGKSTEDLWVLTGRTKAGKPQLYRLDWRANTVKARHEFAGAPSLQGIARQPDAETPLVSVTAPSPRGSNRPGGTVQIWRGGGAGSTEPYAMLSADLGRHLGGALSVSTTGQRAVLPLVFENALAIVDTRDGATLGSVKTGGVAPIGSVISRDGRTAWVSHWGGRWPKDGDPTLPTGLAPTADRVVVDARGIASTGTIARVDLDARAVTASVAVGLHPTAMVWDETRGRLYVANANADTISVIDSAAATVIGTIALRPFDLDLKGVAPTALALAPDGQTLYAALGGLNAVAVIDVPTRQARGYIPTAWYPNHLALDPSGATLAVSTLLGVGAGFQDQPHRRQVHTYRGTVHVVAVPDQATLDGYTTAVAENNHIPTARASLAGAPRATEALPVPRRAGDPSLIEHVVYVIKENRTYDQLFGDLPRGNGDPSLVMFGATVTPNHRKLATDFVLLDNFYATGGNSGDGHQWATQANETSYALWPGYVGRSYPFDGTDPIAYANTGFLWDLALARGRTVRVYGEYAGRLPEEDRQQRQRLLERWKAGDDFTRDWSITAPLAPLNAVLAKNYPPYTQSIPDVVRAQIFLKDLESWQRTGAMPNLVVLQLPSDHTRGATPDYSTASAMVADNDLALGQIVESLSKSPFWPKMAIFVVEDDAQNGVDHVDGHRTIALAVSPYTRRGHVDSTFYAQQSMVKTIELMLGLPTMSLFDLIATDMRASFTTTLDLTPYTAVQPAQSLFAQNPALTAMRGPLRRAAEQTLRMRFDVPDAAPTALLNRITWGLVRGWDVPYPGVRQAVFTPMAGDLDDDEREEVRPARRP